jgi:hypothetical protein
MKSIAQELNEKSEAVALIIKVKGNSYQITSAEEFRHSVFNRRIKKDYKNRSNAKNHWNNSIHIIVKTQDGVVEFDGYVENPLIKVLESFDESGKIERVELSRTEEYFNIKFYLPENTSKLIVDCYHAVENLEEKLVSSFNLDVK